MNSTFEKYSTGKYHEDKLESETLDSNATRGQAMWMSQVGRSGTLQQKLGVHAPIGEHSHQASKEPYYFQKKKKTENWIFSEILSF